MLDVVTAVPLSRLARERMLQEDYDELLRVACVCAGSSRGHRVVIRVIEKLWSEQDGQDVAEYAVMLAVILVIVVGTVRLIGSNANNVFSQVGSGLAQ